MIYYICIILYISSPYYVLTFQGFNQRSTLNINRSSLNDNRKHNSYNYDYADWEKDFETTKMTTHKANATTVQTTTTPTTMEDVLATTTEAVKDTSSESIASLPIVLEANETTTENLLHIFVTNTTDSDTDSPPTFHLETYFPGVTDSNVEQNVTEPPTTENPILVEIEQNLKKNGYFTSSLIVLFKVLTEKNPEDITPLLATLRSQIQRLNAEEKLMKFNGATGEVFEAIVQMLIVEPKDVMQNHFKYAEYAMENRRKVLSKDVNDLIGVLETIYIPTDVYNIANVITNIQIYPNSTETARDVVDEALRTFLFVPFTRIDGTVKETLLVKQINDVLNRRLYPGEDLQVN